MSRSPRTKKKATPLDELADRFGIEGQYRDARRRLRRTSADTKRLLLAAMGVAAGDDVEIHAALQEIERAHWNRTLQPIYVSFVGAGPPAVELTVASGTQEIVWSLILEDGSRQSGRAAAEALALTDEHTVDGKRMERRRLILPEDIPWGYHRLSIDVGEGEAVVIVSPGRCWLPDSTKGRRLWGLAAQLYGLRSQTNWGIGDFGDLRRMAESGVSAGADILGLNPLHAMYPDNPEHASPYSPATRLLLNVLYIDITAVTGFANCTAAQELIASHEFQRDLTACRLAPLVNYAGVSELKLRVLRLLFDNWNSADVDGDKAFEAFRRERGAILELSCLFQCLRESFKGRDPQLSDWRQWPAEYREPASPATVRFAEQHRPDITFMAWLQWLADLQLAGAANAAAPMAIGLYRDMAVGADMAGIETWSNQEAVVSDAHIGAPPDIFNPAGQDWGLPPFHPRALKEQCYQNFIELIRANMRHAGALRIDHVMALQHLYWVPKSHSPADGAYVRYELEDLIGIVALESQRNHCLVVGEDLGTVPDGFRERMAEANILSYRVLFFEQNLKTGLFREPERYPTLSVAVASNHDLPTVPAWWEGSDIELRDRLKLYPDSQEVELQRQLRDRDRRQLRRALEKQRLVGSAARLDTKGLLLLLHTYLARTNSRLAMIQIDDVAEETEPVNVPGSTLQYANWRRKLSLTLEELFVAPRFRQIADIFEEERGLRDRLLENSRP
jgi:4-alpha-glucanotransferase